VGARRRDGVRDLITVLGSAVTAAVTSVLARQALEHGSTPATLLAVRYAIAALVLGVPLIALRSLPRSRRALGMSAAVGVLMLIGGTCEFEAIARLPVAIVIVILCANPLWVLLHTRIVRGQRLGLRRQLSFVAVLAGVVMLVGPRLDDYDVLGLALAVGASVSWGACLLLMQGAARIDGFSTPAAVAAGSVVAGTFALALHPGALDAEILHGPNPGLVTALGVTGAISFGLLALGLRGQHVFDVSVVAATEPLFVAALAAIFLDEQLAAWQLVGMLLVVAGVAWLSRDERLPLMPRAGAGRALS
jgi:drug/metabolite transporter (DMT)-like permease